MGLYPKTFLAALQKMRNNEVMTDVILRLPNDVTIPCHKLILIAASPFFESMFQSGLKESLEKEVQLKFSDADTIRMLVEFIYSNKIDITERNVKTLVEASDFLVLNDLKDECSDFMTTMLNASNCIAFRRFGQKYRLESLITKAYEFVLLNLEKVREYLEFDTLAEDDIVRLVSDDRLKTKNEDVVFEVVADWVNADAEYRTEAFPRIAQHIRFPFCTAETLTRVVSCHPLMWNPECMKLIAEAQHSQFHSGKHPIDNERTIARLNVKKYLVRICNDAKENFCFEYMCTNSIDVKPKWLRGMLDFKSSPIKSNVMVMSSRVSWFDLQGRLFSFDLKSRKTMIHPCRRLCVQRCSMYQLNGKMFMFGGCKDADPHTELKRVLSCDTTVAEFDWEIEEDMLYGVRSPAVVYSAFLNHIYVMGGFTGTTPVLDSRVVQKFDVERDTWQLCAEMPGGCGPGQAVVLNNHIYVIGGGFRGSCYCYDTIEDVWTVCCAPPSLLNVSDSCVSEWQGKILLNIPKQNTAHVYDPVSCQWSVEENFFDEETRKQETKLLCNLSF